MSFTDVAAWALQVGQLLLTAAVAIGIALLLWTLWQPQVQICKGGQDYTYTGFTGQAPVVLTCHAQMPHPRAGGR